MDSTLRQKLLCYLGGAALTMAAGSTAAAQPDLVAIPETIIVDLLDDVEKEGWQTQDVARLVRLLAKDPRRQVRSRVLVVLPSLADKQSLEETEEIFLRLAQDEDQFVRYSMTESFAGWLEAQDALTRLRVITEWAVSANLFSRKAIARVLSYRFQTLGVDWVIEHLSNDPSSKVRTASVFAAESRLQENPAMYSGLVQRLTGDKDRRVRKVARKLMGKRMEAT